MNAILSPSGDHDGFLRPFDGNDDSIAQSDFGGFEYPAREIDGLRFVSATQLDWGVLSLQESYNVYRGSLVTLRATGEYTQDPLAEPLAAQFCGVLPGEMPLEDTLAPAAADEILFYLVTLKINGWKGELGQDSDGLPRAKTRQCP